MNQPTTDRSEAVQEYYGKTLQSGADLKTNACCAINAYPPKIAAILKEVHEEVKDKFYGCGLTIPKTIEGLKVLDLGSGSGRDAYILSKLVGPSGQVIGVDMTPEQLEVANRHIDYHTQAYGYDKPNISFHQGNIEKLDDVGLASASLDLIVSNCVINLVNNKQAVFDEAFRVLKEGGELYFSDVYANKRMPQALVDDPVLYGECLTGSLYWNDFLTAAKKAGFADPRWVEGRPLTINNQEVEKKIGSIQFYSVTARLIKVAGLEADCEEYGQAVRYKGGVEDQDQTFVLDSGHSFEKGKVISVCGNSYRMLAQTRFAPYFDFFGDFETHYGIFPGCGGAFPFVADTDSSAQGTDCGC